MGRHSSSSGKTEAGGEQYRKEEKHHKHMEKLAKLGAVAAGAYARVRSKHLMRCTTYFLRNVNYSCLTRTNNHFTIGIQHEKHEARKDPEHARSHKMKEKIAATVAAGSAGFAIHEHHKKKEAKKHARHAHHHRYNHGCICTCRP